MQKLIHRTRIHSVDGQRDTYVSATAAVELFKSAREHGSTRFAISRRVRSGSGDDYSHLQEVMRRTT